jgi:hypothetical protein
VTGAETGKEVSKDSEVAANEAEGENMDPSHIGVVLMAKTLSGHVVEIRLDQDRPKSFKVQYIASYGIHVQNVWFGNYSHSLFVYWLLLNLLKVNKTLQFHIGIYEARFRLLSLSSLILLF